MRGQTEFQVNLKLGLTPCTYNPKLPILSISYPSRFLLRQVKPEDLEQFGLIPEIIGRLPVIAPLDALGVEDLARILQSPKNSLVQQFRKLVRFHGADLAFTDAAIKEIARIASERGTGARGLRSVVEEVLEGVLFDAEAGVRYVITDKTVKGGEALKQSTRQTGAPLKVHLLRRFGAKQPS